MKYTWEQSYPPTHAGPLIPCAYYEDVSHLPRKYAYSCMAVHNGSIRIFSCKKIIGLCCLCSLYFPIRRLSTWWLVAWGAAGETAATIEHSTSHNLKCPCTETSNIHALPLQILMSRCIACPSQYTVIMHLCPCCGSYNDSVPVVKL